MDINLFKQVIQDVRRYTVSLDLNKVKEEMKSVMSLLVMNKKLSKGDNLNYGLELLPSVLSGTNFCPKAGQCMLNCLVFTGKGNRVQQRSVIEGNLNTILKKRARRSFLLNADPSAFEELLIESIAKRIEYAKGQGKKVAFRLNVFSDLDWRHIAKRFPETTFYDYTKVWERKPLENYNLTYSFSEKVTVSQAVAKLRSGNNVAVVFNKTLPEVWNGFKVVDGDINDNRYQDAGGVVIGLAVKRSIRHEVNAFIA